MSGIVTIFGYRPSAPEVDPGELVAIRESMVSRGPDDARAWYSRDRRIAVGHRRLAIPDLASAEPEPMFPGRYVVNFDGEIYNYPQLRATLEREGVVFDSRSDSGILPHLFARRGLDMLQMLRGMFAFTLIDLERRRMLVARDPYGIKPIYVSDDGQTLRIASQVSALLAGGHVSKDVDPAGAAGFFLLGSVPEPFTIRRDIRAVPAGHFIWVDETGPSQPRRYFSVAEEFARAHDRDVHTFEEDAAIDELRHAVRDSVRYHLAGDAPVGLFLSDGVDSTTIAAHASEIASTPLRAMTIAYSDYDVQHVDDAAHARAVARRFGAEHATRLITRQEVAAEMPRLLAAMDQPTIHATNSYFVAKVAAEAGIRVAISGVGGDELFGSDPSFRWIPPLVAAAWLPSRIPGLAGAFRRIVDALSPGKPKVAGLLEFAGSYAGAYFLRRGLFMPWELESLLGREMADEGLNRLDLVQLIGGHLDPDPGTAHARLATLDATLNLRNQRLRDTDWTSMAHSVEVRLPLVDASLIRRLAPLLLATRTGAKQLFASTVMPPAHADITTRTKAEDVLPSHGWIPAGTPASESWARRWARAVWGHFSSE